MMLNLIDALGTFENPVAQLVVGWGSLASPARRLPGRRGGPDARDGRSRVKRELPV